MNIRSLGKFGIPNNFIEKIESDKVSNLYPPQLDAVKNGIIEGKNLVLSFPTASGKTLMATLAIIGSRQRQRKKIIYVVPLIALANEKYRYYKDFFKDYLKVALSCGDLDSGDVWLKDYDLIIITCEKLDSLIRHGTNWLGEVSLVIIDEIHLLNDVSRGPTLEIIICVLKKLISNYQILALSATINNGDELAKWLGAKLVKSDFRPVKLYEGVNFDNQIKFYTRANYNIENEEEEGLLEDSLKKKKQTLFFVSTRRSAESLSERLSQDAILHLSKEEKDNLKKIAQQIESVLEVPTKQCKKLAYVIKKGCSFHHAGLLSKQKNIIEENFRKGLIKAIVATPTLAMGINLPAFRVVIRDIKRYSSGLGSTFIPVMEYKQFAGRAGRPQYDEFGESVIMAKSELEAYDLIERYIKASPENIESKLAQEVALRIHLLSLISSGIISSKQSIIDFFNSTFFSFQYQDVHLLEEKIVKVISNLLEWKFIDKNPHGYFATELGRRISQLYLDPLTANNFISALENLLLVQDIKMLSVLQVISYSSEMHPLLSIKSKDHLVLNEIINLMRDNFLMPVPAMYEEEYDVFLSSLKTALVLESWTEEETEDTMLDKFQITPGELHAKLEIAEWLMYCLMEITKILNHKELIKELKKIRIRLIYGVKDELLELVSLREIGRVRARRLFDKGIKNLAALKNIPDNKLSLVLGPKVSRNVKEQLTKVTTKAKIC